MYRQHYLVPFIIAGVIGMTASLFGPSALAHSTASSKQKAEKAIAVEETAFGRQGNPKKVTRTVEITMSDTMRFTPAELRIKQGETVRFVVKNSGQILHELVLGTMEELKAHGELMKKNPGMEHDEPYQAHVAPGKKEDVVWEFTRPGQFHFACLIPGHFEAGMIGAITVAAK